MSLDAVILAAGYSSRAEGFKMGFRLDQKALLQHVIESFYPICDQIIVVGGYQHEKLLPLIQPYQEKVRLVINKDFTKGMFSSVQTGVKEVTADRFFLTPGDYPLINTKLCQFLAQTKEDVIIPSFQRKGGHPVLLSKQCIEGLMAEKDTGNLKDFLKRFPISYVTVEEEGILMDLDTKEDYFKIQQKMNSNKESQSIDSADFGIINGSVYLDGAFINTNLYIKDEKIECMTTERLDCKQEIDAGGLWVLPGFVDPHVHFDLGVGVKKSSDDFYMGSKKAAFGGITTYIDFLDPVKKADQIPEAFQKRMHQAEKSMVDYAFHTTLAGPQDTAENMVKESKKVGITSIKIFTTYADTDRRTKEDYIYELLKESKKEEIKILVHAEKDELISTDQHILVKDHEKSRPVQSEKEEVLCLAKMARETGGNLYIVHVSAGSTVREVAELYVEELKSHQVTLESCPHYFIFDSSIYEEEEGYLYTMTPPLRPSIEKELLKNEINHIQTIGTDHCPADISLKKHTYTSDIFMGVGGVKYSFLNMFTLFGEQILEKFTKEPASAYGLFPEKGSLFVGTDADLVLFDPNAATVVDDRESIYHGMQLKGSIKKVFLRGDIIIEDNQMIEKMGKYIKR